MDDLLKRIKHHEGFRSRVYKCTEGYDPIVDEIEDQCSNTGSTVGDANNDGGQNVLDIVTLANCVLSANCSELDYGACLDMNFDGGYNVLDIVTLANCVLASNCG